MADSDSGFGFLEDQLRKKQLLDQLQQQQQATTAGSSSYQPPSNVQGAANYQPQSQYTPQLMTPPAMQTQPPSAQRYEQSATNLQNIGQAPQARDYPRNKLLTALVAPLMFKQILRDPQKGMAGLDLLTRKGYGAAEQKFEANLEQAERSHKVESEVLNERLKIFNDNINASRSQADMQMSVGKYNDWVQGLPQEQQMKAALLAEAQGRAAKEKAPHIDDNHIYSVQYKDEDGKLQSTNAYVRTFPDGSPHDYVDLATGKPIQNRLGVTLLPTPTTAGALNERQQLFADGINRYKLAHDGQSPTGKDLDDIAKHVGQVMAAPVDERQAALATRERYNMAAKDFLSNKIGPISKPIDVELGSIRQLKSSLSQANANGVAANLAVVEIATAMSGGLRPISRYNLAEINKILGSAGGIEGIRTAIDHWISSGGQASGVPQAVLKQIGQLADVVQKELRQQQKTIDKYRKLAAKAPTGEAVGDLYEQLDNELENPPMSLEDAAKARGIIK